MLVESSPADECAGQGDQAVVDVESSFPSDGQAAVLVEQGECLFHDVPEPAQSLDAGGAAAGDHRHDAPVAAVPAKVVAVVSGVGQDRVEPAPGPAPPTGDGGYGVEQRDGLGDVVDVPTCGDHRQRHPIAVADQVVFRARFAPVDR